MSSTRRVLLGSAAAYALGLAAGCLGNGGGGGEPTDTADGTETPTPTTTDTATSSPPAGEGSRISVAAVDPAPDLPLEPAVEVTRATPTADHPAQVRVTLANTTDRLVRAGEGRAIFFEYVDDDSREFLFLPPGSDYPADPGCWRLTEPIAVTEEYRIVDFEAGASESRHVDLYGAPTGGDACLPVGEYRFETSIAVGGMDDTPTQGDATWGFSLRVT